MAQKNGASVLKEILSLSDVAALTVQSERSVQRLTKQGVLRVAKDSQGRELRARFVLDEVIPQFCEYLRELSSADPHSEAYNHARCRRMNALAEVEENALRLQSGELIEREHVMRVVSSVLYAVRNHLLSIPSRLMHQLVGKTDPREVNQLVRAEVELALREASEFDMEQIAARNAAARQGAAEPAS
jgi:phage terminase Nu1 subunit (DNA packaging protein)